MKNQYRGEDCLKRGRLGQFVDLRGGGEVWQERGGGLFWGRERGWYLNAHYVWYLESKGIKFKLTQPLYLRSGFNFTIIYPFKSSGIEKILHIFCCFNENITNITLNFCKLPSPMHFCYFRKYYYLSS